MKKIIHRILSNWPFLVFIRASQKLVSFYEVRNAEISNKETDRVLVSNYFRELQVVAGPFKGLKYHDVDACGSTFVAKLAGSYECEIITFIDRIIEKKYNEIWDIGCAEGYYAVGLAQKIPGAKVVAFDIDSNAQDQCKKLSKSNNVEVDVRGECTAAEINKNEFTNGLIISDCEGYELTLFSDVNVSELAVDYLIEIHEWPLEKDVAAKIKLIFESTHNISVINSISDLRKAHDFHGDLGLGDIPLIDRYNIVREGRGEEMQWFYCERKVIG